MTIKKKTLKELHFNFFTTTSYVSVIIAYHFFDLFLYF